MTEDQPSDSVVSLVAIGVLAYLVADLAHHVLGHGVACLALGGAIRSLTSVHVDCTLSGAGIDIAGPLANLAAGVIALIVLARQRASAVGLRVFLALVAAFNLLWFAAQFVFSLATMTDDWAYALRSLASNDTLRWSLVAFGTLAYVATLRLIAVSLTGFDANRMKRIVRSAYLAGGAAACLVGAFDRGGFGALVHHAVPQSFGAAAGLLLVPWLVRPPSMWGVVRGMPLSFLWIAAASAVAALSVVFLGPGFALAL